MASKDFIFQGFTTRNHIDAIRHVIEIPDIEEIVLSVAFINEDGVRLIENNLRPFASKTKVFSGIRNDITSRQGLARLLELGVSVYVVDTGARGVIFHPKLYLSRGAQHARLLVGSANLTLGGLNNNIEASLALDLNLDEQSDREFVSEIQEQFTELPGRYPEHIFIIRGALELDRLQNSGRLLDEAETLPPRPAVTASRPSNDPISRIRLDVIPLSRASRRARSEPVIRRAVGHVPQGQPQTQAATNLELVWQSKALTERDLNIPHERGTHATGSINLDKGLLDEAIDHRHYFRDAAFAHLQWTPRATVSVEEAEARFQLIIKGIYYGEFPLQIRHSTDTNSRTYQQRNAMTRLSWGPIREYVSRPDLIGRTLSLYRDEADQGRFVLEID
ncbi:MAG: hypothetical protein G01um101438_481 [Parcubacteria group bacterium Gr01-1014_38]|nr:MAG: hypothetical protein G01um101438_481 [Parcubacteria group bacterium Gr01-1014_38]